VIFFILCSYLKASQNTWVSVKENEEKSIRSLLAGERVQTLFLCLRPRKTSFPQRFYRRTHEAEEASEEISAAGAENTLSFSASEFRESSERHVQALISFDYPSRRLEARLLLCPCAVTEIAQPPFRRWRLNLGPDET
jgi:hypothetical protein